MTPIERAQSAIAATLGLSPFPIESFMISDGRMISTADIARAVIAAMREPGQSLEAGASCLWAGSRIKADAKATEVWTAIVDAMLAESSVNN